MTNGERELEHGDEHQVTPLELFFDLVFVFAITQVTSLLADDPTWRGVLRGMLVLAALWWAWSVYAWLTSALDVDEGGVRLAMLASTGAMLIVALAVPAPSETMPCCLEPPTSSSASFISSSPPSSLATIPTAVARFSGSPRPRPPRELAEHFFNVTRWTDMPRGGHFAALEEPELLANEIREFFRPLRRSRR